MPEVLFVQHGPNEPVSDGASPQAPCGSVSEAEFLAALEHLDSAPLQQGEAHTAATLLQIKDEAGVRELSEQVATRLPGIAVPSFSHWGKNLNLKFL